MSGKLVAIGALAAGVLYLSARSSSSVPEQQGVHFEFDADAQGWQPLPSPKAVEMKVVSDPGAGQRQRALEIRYKVEKGKVAGIRHDARLTEGAGVSLRVKTDADATLVIGAIEKDGSSYNKAFFTTAGEWQTLSASFSEFELAKDSKDENHRLDVDQIKMLVVLDAAGFLQKGIGSERHLWIASYDIPSRMATVTETVAQRSPGGGPTPSWDFESDVQGWTAIPPPGGANAKVAIARVSGNAAAGSGALQVRYKVERRKIAGVVRPVNGLGGAGVHALIQTSNPTVVVLGLVERDGSSYNYPVHTQANEWQDVDVLYENFSLAEDSKDENGRLDPDQIQALVVGDAAGFLGDGGGDRELLIGKYEIVSSGTATRTASAGGSSSSSGGYVPLLKTGAATESGARATAGITYQPGKFRQGFLADGPGELVAVPTRGLRRDEGTIELWISPRFNMRDVQDFTGLVTMQNEPFIVGFKTSLLVFYSKARQIAVMTNGATDRTLTTAALDWKAGEWHHLAVSWGSRGTRLYLDGKVAAESRRTDGPAAIAPDIVLGNQSWTLLSQRFSNTVIDEFRLSSTQRSDQEIQASANASQPLTADASTIDLEHFDGSPAPPIMLAADAESFHARSAGRASTWTATAPDKFPAGSTISYTIATPGGKVVDRGQKPAPAGSERIEMPMPTLDAPGFYRVDFKLEHNGTLLNQGQDWIRIARADNARAEAASPRGADAMLFGASASQVDSEDREDYFRRAAAAGVRSVRLPFEWAEIEPKNGQFVWTRYDQILGWAKRYGVELVPSLYWENPQPAWAGRGKANPSGDDMYPPENMKAWGDFVTAVVSRYKNDIHWWIPVNEPNLPRYWQPKPDARAYAAVLKVAREAALRADPNARILGLSTSGVDLRYLEEAFKAGALDNCDAVGVHPYRGPHGPDEVVPINILDPGSTPGTFLDGLRAVKRLMDKYGGDRKKLWLDEFGFTYRNDFIVPNWGVSEENVAAYLVKTFVDAKASGIVDRILWYSFWGGEYGSFSLLTPDGRPTLPFVAYVAAAEHLGQAALAGDGGRGRDIRSVKFTSARESTEVLWSPKGTAEVALQTGQRALDLYGFPIDEANSSRRLKLTALPSFIVQPKS